MTNNAVTTELVADQPVVVVLHHDQRYLSRILKELANKKVVVEAYSVSELLQSGSIQQRLTEAYKIAWVTETKDYLAQSSEVETTASLLSDFQQKTTLFFPVITAFQEQVLGEVPHAAQYFNSQEAAILFHNTYVPSATFVFGQDIIDLPSETSLLHLITQNLYRGTLYGIKTQLHPQSLDSFCQRAIRYFLQPERTSVLIRGNTVQGVSVAKEIKQLYQSYHFSLVDIQEVMVASGQTVPFSVVENFVTDDISPLVSRFVQSLPSPDSLTQNTIWNELFSAQKDAHYGIEVPTQSSEPKIVEPVEDEPDSFSQENEQITPEPPVETESDKVSETPKEVTQSEKAVSRLEQSSPEENKQQKNEAESQRSQVQFDLNQEIQDIFSQTHTTQKQAQTKRIQQKTKVTKTRSKKRTAVFYGGLAFTGMGLGVVCLAIIFSFSVSLLKSAVTEYLVKSVSAAENTSTEIAQLDSVNRLKSVVGVQADTYSMILSLPALEDAQTLVKLSDQLNTVTTETTKADELAEMLYLQLIGLDGGNSVSTAANLNTQALTAYENTASFVADWKATSAAFGDDSSTQDSLEKFESDLAVIRSGVQSLQHFSPLFEDLFGVSSKRTYAIVLQNNQELRPTGGFIEDVALLTFQDGSLISSTIHSGYEIDRQMSGEVIPPPEIKQYLNEQSWHFVDSNWNPHFPDSAEQIAWFIDKSLGVTVDGVMTIDLDGLATVLEATGPLDMPQYNEVLTHKNLHDRFEFHSEISLVDTSQDYRKEVFQAFIHKVTNLPREKVGPFFGALTKNLENHHSLLAFTAAEELNASKVLGWSGSLLEPNCPSQLNAKSCEVDTISQVEANVGINKANYYLQRSIDHTVALEATQAAHTRIITYENTAQTDSWPKGPYKAFVRLYMPSSAIPSSVVINNTPISENQWSLSQENNRQVLGFYLDVPVKSTRVVSVQYTVPYSKPSQSFSYAFFEQRQPGSGPTPFGLTIKPNDKLKPTVIAPQATFEENTIFFNEASDGHGFYGVTFE